MPLPAPLARGATSPGSQRDLQESSETGWHTLAVARAAIAGRYARLTGDAERRHYPKEPRVRPPRFTRPIVISTE